MATSSFSLVERASEIRAHAEVTMAARILGEAIMDPSTKRFTRARAARIERWLQIEAAAKAQASGLQALAKAAPRKAAKRNNVPIASGSVTMHSMPDEARVEGHAASGLA